VGSVAVEWKAEITSVPEIEQMSWAGRKRILAGQYLQIVYVNLRHGRHQHLLWRFFIFFIPALQLKICICCDVSPSQTPSSHC
jgi:hypothetical protein